MPRKRTPLLERVWGKVDTSRECWLWKGYTDDEGYGLVNEGGKDGNGIRVSRLVWKWAYGPLPDNLCVLHSCDNPSCVRPSHLFKGTRADNLLDMTLKNRDKRDGKRKLTDEEATDIIQRWQSGQTQATIGRLYRINPSTVSRLVRGKRKCYART